MPQKYFMTISHQHYKIFIIVIQGHSYTILNFSCYLQKKLKRSKWNNYNDISTNLEKNNTIVRMTLINTCYTVSEKVTWFFKEVKRPGAIQCQGVHDQAIFIYAYRQRKNKKQTNTNNNMLLTNTSNICINEIQICLYTSTSC